MKYSTYHSHWPYTGMDDKLRIQDFRQMATSHLEQFQLAQREVEVTYRILCTASTLLPSQCDQALDSVQNLQQSIQTFNHLLDSTEQLPNQVIPKRYLILFSLHYIDELSCQLLPLIHSFRRICLNSSRDTNRLQRQILRKFESILETGEKVEPASQVLLE
jgi:hypothetical protein